MSIKCIIEFVNSRSPPPTPLNVKYSAMLQKPNIYPYRIAYQLKALYFLPSILITWRSVSSVSKEYIVLLDAFRKVQFPQVRIGRNNLVSNHKVPFRAQRCVISCFLNVQSRSQINTTKFNSSNLYIYNLRNKTNLLYFSVSVVSSWKLIGFLKKIIFFGRS